MLSNNEAFSWQLMTGKLESALGSRGIIAITPAYLEVSLAAVYEHCALCEAQSLTVIMTGSAWTPCQPARSSYCTHRIITVQYFT